MPANGVDDTAVLASRLRVSAPSGLAGNLIATALIRAGLDRDVLNSLPARLQLDGFEAVWDEYGVCDGRLIVDCGHGGTAQQLAALLHDRLPGAVGVLAANIATARFRHERNGSATVAVGEVWCDTAFDVAAAAVGLAALDLEGVTVYGPLPTTVADHPVARALLAGWAFTPHAAPVEIVTPTAAAVLAICGSQAEASAAPAADSAYALRGRFVRLYGLEPVLVWPGVAVPSAGRGEADDSTVR